MLGIRKILMVRIFEFWNMLLTAVMKSPSQERKVTEIFVQKTQKELMFFWRQADGVNDLLNSALALFFIIYF